MNAATGLQLFAAIMIVMGLATTVVNLIYFFRYRKQSYTARIKLPTAAITLYVVISYILTLYLGIAEHTTLLLGNFLMMLGLLVWAIVNIIYKRVSGNREEY
jgi:amino acid transporter